MDEAAERVWLWWFQLLFVTLLILAIIELFVAMTNLLSLADTMMLAKVSGQFMIDPISSGMMTFSPGNSCPLCSLRARWRV